MNNFREGLNALREISDPEKIKMALERIIGKKLADYEGIDALVATMMGYYNEELKNKAKSNHTHDDRYYTESEIDTKFKNFCPYSVGEILLTTNSENPASKYLGTTWQKIEGRFLLGTSGSGASKQAGGSNQKTITQNNLPAIKVQLDRFSLSRGTMEIEGNIKNGIVQNSPLATGDGAFSITHNTAPNGAGHYSDKKSSANFKASRNWTGSTSPVSPQTVNLGNGQALDITPNYYTVHMWLRTN